MKQMTKTEMRRPGSTEAVRFTDGMLVTAEDLNAATAYPLELMQVLVRAYFGCGIVCGLGVTRAEGKDSCGNPHGFAVTIERGVALGCDGYPIELCKDLKLDLSPDDCGCKPTGEIRYVAIRRVTAPDVAPSRGCGCCGSGAEPEGQCTRVRDHVLVAAFDEATLPAGICMRPREKKAEEQDGQPAPHVHPNACECLQHCPDCDRCAEPWVLLATLKVDDKGVMAGHVNDAGDVGDKGGPQYVKPIDCVCEAERSRAKELKALEDRLKALEARTNAAGTPETPPVPPEPGRDDDPFKPLGDVVGNLRDTVNEMETQPVPPEEGDDRFKHLDELIGNLDERVTAIDPLHDPVPERIQPLAEDLALLRERAAALAEADARFASRAETLGGLSERLGGMLRR